MSQSGEPEKSSGKSCWELLVWLGERSPPVTEHCSPGYKSQLKYEHQTSKAFPKLECTSSIIKPSMPCRESYWSPLCWGMGSAPCRAGMGGGQVGAKQQEGLVLPGLELAAGISLPAMEGDEWITNQMKPNVISALFPHNKKLYSVFGPPDCWWKFSVHNPCSIAVYSRQHSDHSQVAVWNSYCAGKLQAIVLLLDRMAMQVPVQHGLWIFLFCLWL